jgi:signal transduction histidine kinase
LRASHPSRAIELQVAGDAKGVWDPHRLHQLLGNLVLNALKYGAPDAPVLVSIVGLPTEVEFRVHNRGTMIEASTLNYIFEPLVRGSKEAGGVCGNEGSLGLGLYIAHQISIAHGGNINARSDEFETVFTTRLPRLSKRRPV